jgi:hypothetical protein
MVDVSVEIKHVKSPVGFSTKEILIPQMILELYLFSSICLHVDSIRCKIYYFIPGTSHHVRVPIIQSGT